MGQVQMDLGEGMDEGREAVGRKGRKEGEERMTCENFGSKSTYVTRSIYNRCYTKEWYFNVNSPFFFNMSPLLGDMAVTTPLRRVKMSFFTLWPRCWKFIRFGSISQIYFSIADTKRLEIQRSPPKDRTQTTSVQRWS